MNQRKFGRTGLQVSELCLGAMQFGWLVDEATSFQLLDAYYAAGGRFIQTVGYGLEGAFPSGLSCSESVVGAWLQQHPGIRKELVLSTRIRPSQRSIPACRNLAEAVRHQCEASLRRLAVSHVDLLVCEWSDEFLPHDGVFLPIDEVLKGLDALLSIGNFRYIGSAGFPVWRLMESLGRSKALKSCRFESLQADFSLLDDNLIHQGAHDLSKDYRVALLAQSPLAGGFLTGAYSHKEAHPPSARKRRLLSRYANARGFATLTELEHIARELDATSAQVALAWVLNQQNFASVIVGFNSVEQLQATVEAAQLHLDPDQMHRLERAAAIPAGPEDAVLSL